MEEIAEIIEEKLMEIFEGIEKGSEESLEKLKKLKNYLEDLCEFLSFVDDEDTIESLKKKFEEMDKNFERVLLENVRAVG